MECFMMKKTSIRVSVLRLIISIPLMTLILTTTLISSVLDNRNVAAGLPTRTDDSNAYIIDRPQYVVSYCGVLNLPNYAAYELTINDFGSAKRYNGNFITDTTLPKNFYRVKHSDYTNSGYDRGHLVRSNDRTINPEDNKSTFYLTNIIPQTPDLNRLV